MIFKFLHQILRTKYPFYNPLYRLYQRYYKKELGCIYMLHRVTDFEEHKLYPNENMKVSPSFLENLIISYKRKGIKFISLDDLYEYMTGNIKIRPPFVVFTIDDGYIDNFTNAYPIFKKYNVPFTIYITTDFPDKKAVLWWYALEDYIIERDNIILSSGERIIAKTQKEKNDAFLYIRSLILKLPQKDLEKNINALLMSNIDFSIYVNKLSMDWNQIKMLSQDSLCTIAGHSISHPAFNKLQDSELDFEISEGCKRLRKSIDKDIIHFAYPFGSLNEVGEIEYSQTEKYDFKTIVTTLGGAIKKDSNPKRLPRYMLYELD